MKKIYAFLFLLNSLAVVASPSETLVGGTITNNKTKARMGIICSKKQKVEIGEVQVDQCTDYDVVLINGKNEPDFIASLTTSYVSNPHYFKNLPENRLHQKYYSEIYEYFGAYYNRDAYFYALTAFNAYGCTEKWGWCLLIPLTAVLDTAITLGTNTGYAIWDGVFLSIHGLDQLVGNAALKSTKRKMVKDVIFMLNTSKKGKNRNINAERFDLFKSYL